MAEQPLGPPPGQRVTVQIQDHTGNKRHPASLVVGATVRDLITAMVIQLGLPATDSSGRRVVYHLAFGERQLQGNETLSQAGVIDGSTLTLVPEPVAGGR